MDTSINEQRAALRALSRRELQNRAKQLGVRANRKSIDIVEGILKTLSRPGSPAKSLDTDHVDPCCSAATAPGPGELLYSHVGGVLQMDGGTACDENPYDAARTLEMSAPNIKGGCKVVQAATPNSSSSSPLDGALVSTAPAHMTTPPVPTNTLASMSEMASRASALALAAQLGRLDLQLKASAAKAPLLRAPVWGPTPTGMDQRQPEAPSLPFLSPLCDCDQPIEMSNHGVGQHQRYQKHESPEQQLVRRLAFVQGSPATSGLVELPQHNAGGGHDEEAESLACSPMTLGEAPSAAHEAADGLLERLGALHLSSAAAGPGGGVAAHATSTGMSISSPTTQGGHTSVAAGSSSVAAGSATAALVTGRTPMRQQRLMGHGVAPSALSCVPGTPLGAAAAGGSSAAAVCTGSILRTPLGSKLRTPARRVAVCTDETQARMVESWVLENMAEPAIAIRPKLEARGLDWRGLLGLNSVKEHLSQVTGTPRDAQTHGPCSGGAQALQEQPSARVRTQSILPHSAAGSAVKTSTTQPHASAAAAGKSRLPSQSGACRSRPQSSLLSGIPKVSCVPAPASRTPGTKGPPGKAAAAGATPATPKSGSVAAVSVDPPVLPLPGPNISVLLCGASGLGKSSLARALAAHLDASYMAVPSNLAAGAALPPLGKPEDVLRAVFRVAAKSSESIVIHLPDPEEWAGEASISKNPDCRRLRTELMVALDALAPVSAADARRAASASGACSKRVVLVATSSRPWDLDDALAARLGETGMLMASPPGADDREEMLVGKLAMAGAALGVEQIGKLVRNTEGWSMALLAAACASAAEAARAKASSEHLKASAAEPSDAEASNTPLHEGHVASALERLERAAAKAREAAAVISQWHARIVMASSALP